MRFNTIGNLSWLAPLIPFDPSWQRSYSFTFFTKMKCVLMKYNLHLNTWMVLWMWFYLDIIWIIRIEKIRKHPKIFMVKLGDKLKQNICQFNYPYNFSRLGFEKAIDFNARNLFQSSTPCIFLSKLFCILIINIISK